MNYLPFVIVIVLLGGMMLFSQRNRRRQVAEELVRNSKIGVGTEVMTTSGLYGTVVSRHDEDETVTLSIAPGVEVKWALAALRDAASLADKYRKAIPGEGADESARLGRPVELSKDVTDDAEHDS